ncbi:hypothetical protein Tco_0006167 [Tanacetum coccineum]
MYTFSPMMVANSRKHHCRVRSYTREVLVISTNLDIQKNHYPLDFRNRRGDEARIKNTWYNQGLVNEGNHKRPFEEERSDLTDELTFPAIPQNQLTDEHIILEGVIKGNQKMQSSNGRFFRRNVSSSGNNRSSSNYGKGRKKQNDANGVCDNKMLFTIQSHNRKDKNEKPQSVERLYRNADTWKGCKVHGRRYSDVNRGMERASIINRIPIQMFPMTLEGTQPNKNGIGRRRKNRVSYGRRSILFHLHSKRIKELDGYTSEDDGEGLSRSKRTKRGNILGRNSNKKQNKGRKVSWPYGNKGRSISKFIPKLVELQYLIREVRIRFETTEGFGWTNEAEEA